MSRFLLYLSILALALSTNVYADGGYAAAAANAGEPLPSAAAPGPATLLLVGAGLVAMGLVRRPRAAGRR